MKAALQIDLTFEQILSIVQQLSKEEKLRLSKELEKEVINTKLSRILKEFKTDNLDENTINEEVESVRQMLYDKQKH
ncbi:MAG: hypothetical protein M9959_09130 [Chitinophagaceae bacterium]|nr:hypothetical protein [Chitinophagaceae bacterium]